MWAVSTALDADTGRQSGKRISWRPAPGGLATRRRWGRREPQTSKRVHDLEKGEAVEVGVPGADPADSMLAHEDRRVGIMEQIAGEPGSSVIACSATAACRSVGTSTPNPGEARRAATNAQACGALHGRLMTRGWVVTRRNSYRIGQVVYQASGRPRWRSSQSRDLAYYGESASAA